MVQTGGPLVVVVVVVLEEVVVVASRDWDSDWDCGVRASQLKLPQQRHPQADQCSPVQRLRHFRETRASWTWVEHLAKHWDMGGGMKRRCRRLCCLVPREFVGVRSFVRVFLGSFRSGRAWTLARLQPQV